LGAKDQIPWFPGRLSDLDLLNQEVMEAGEELTSDHPGFSVSRTHVINL
jgi:hypothetical protein